MPPSASPDWWLARTGHAPAESRAAAEKCSDAYTRNAVTAYAGIDRIDLAALAGRSVGIAGEASRRSPATASPWTYKLVGLRQLAMLNNHANSDLNPTRGLSGLTSTLRAWVDIGPGGDFFTIIRLTGR